MKHKLSSDNNEEFYILYLEYLGGLIPLLTARRVSKLKPDFTIFDPFTEQKIEINQNNNNIFIDKHESSGYNTSSSKNSEVDSLKSNDLNLPTIVTDQFDDKIVSVSVKQSSIENISRIYDAIDEEAIIDNNPAIPSNNTQINKNLNLNLKKSQLFRSPLRSSKIIYKRLKLLNSNENQHQQLKGIKNKNNNKLLVQVKSNIWGTKFRFNRNNNNNNNSEHKFPITTLGNIIYKTSLFHLQPRQMKITLDDLTTNNGESKIENKNNLSSSPPPLPPILLPSPSKQMPKTINIEKYLLKNHPSSIDGLNNIINNDETTTMAISLANKKVLTKRTNALTVTINNEFNCSEKILTGQELLKNLSFDEEDEPNDNDERQIKDNFLPVLQLKNENSIQVYKNCSFKFNNQVQLNEDKNDSLNQTLITSQTKKIDNDDDKIQKHETSNTTIKTTATTNTTTTTTTNTKTTTTTTLKKTIKVKTTQTPSMTQEQLEILSLNDRLKIKLNLNNKSVKFATRVLQLWHTLVNNPFQNYRKMSKNDNEMLFVESEQLKDELTIIKDENIEIKQDKESEKEIIIDDYIQVDEDLESLNEQKDDENYSIISKIPTTKTSIASNEGQSTKTHLKLKRRKRILSNLRRKKLDRQEKMKLLNELKNRNQFVLNNKPPIWNETSQVYQLGKNNYKFLIYLT
jgi:hypothetical protein